MELWVASILVSLTTLCNAHYEGYPFKHINNGRYGASYKFANYEKGAAKPFIPPMTVSIDINGKNFAFVPADKRTQLEYDFRHVDGFPVHVGNGQFYFLGNFKGSCDDTDQAGFYFTGDSKSYMVCDNGRAHRFECPNGTRNKGATYFQYHQSYDHSDLCSEHDNSQETPKPHLRKQTAQEERVEEEQEVTTEAFKDRPTETTREY